jgi:hypothetical protein
MIPRERKPSDKGRGVRPRDQRCTHDDPMLVIDTETGYYARCLRCLTAGPERPSAKAARSALQVLGARTVADIRG